MRSESRAGTARRLMRQAGLRRRPDGREVFQVGALLRPIAF